MCLVVGVSKLSLSLFHVLVLIQRRRLLLCLYPPSSLTLHGCLVGWYWHDNTTADLLLLLNVCFVGWLFGCARFWALLLWWRGQALSVLSLPTAGVLLFFASVVWLCVVRVHCGER